MKAEKLNDGVFTDDELEVIERVMDPEGRGYPLYQVRIDQAKSLETSYLPSMGQAASRDQTHLRLNYDHYLIPYVVAFLNDGSVWTVQRRDALTQRGIPEKYLPR